MTDDSDPLGSGPPVEAFAAAAALVEPEARLLAVRTLPGGLSAQITVLELLGPDDRPRRLVVRRARSQQAQRARLSIADQFSLLLRLHPLELPTPTPRLLDDSGTIFTEPYSVFDYVDGAPVTTSSDPAETGRAFATQLAAVHRVDLTLMAPVVLPDRADNVARDLASAPPVADERMREGLVRRLLGDRWPPPAPDRTTLLHGDFWAGNILWRDGAIVAVIDWEEAGTGDPLADVATTRLDLLWAYGAGAVSAFTDHYFFLTELDRAPLAVWDLAAALRPAGNLSLWAADWADFGRPDIDASRLRADHRSFLDQALEALG